MPGVSRPPKIVIPSVATVGSDLVGRNLLFLLLATRHSPRPPSRICAPAPHGHFERSRPTFSSPFYSCKRVGLRREKSLFVSRVGPERTAAPSHAFRAMKSLLLLQFPVTHHLQIVVCIPLIVIPSVARNLLFLLLATCPSPRPPPTAAHPSAGTLLTNSPHKNCYRTMHFSNCEQAKKSSPPRLFTNCETSFCPSFWKNSPLSCAGKPFLAFCPQTSASS